MVPSVEDIDPFGFHMENEPHLNKIEPVVDEETGLRYTYRDVAMVRGATDENTREMKVWLDPIPHVLVDQSIPLRGWYKPKHEAPNRRPRPCYTDSILTQPYGGFCAVGCGFCYINNGVRGYRGQGLATVDPRYGEKVRRQLRRMRLGAAVYMSSFIDPFLELEDVYGNTRATAEAATEVGLPIYFLTRRRVPGWAYDLLARNPFSYQQFSINTPSAEDWQRLSPRAVPLDEMFEQIREMQRRGIYVSIQVNPIVAGITSNDEVVELIHLLAEAGADHLIFKFVEIVYPSAAGMIRQMRRRFGSDRAYLFEGLFVQNIGGVRTIAEEYRRAALDRFLVETKRAGVTMGLCYEYEYERDAEGNVVSKTGVSMGARYLTADQCHGHRVPMHVRDSADEPFRPLEVCPPSGCLTCGDERGEDEVPCGDVRLGRAPALRPADYNVFPVKDLREWEAKK
jgi:DNA repair photolyase